MRLAAGAAFSLDHLAVEAVGVVVVVAVDGDRARRTRAEETEIFRRLRHLAWDAGAADVRVQAYDAVGRSHDDVEVVRDEEHGAAVPVPDLGDLLVKGDLAGEVDALDRLVEDEDIRPGEQRAGDEDALQLAAGERRDLCVEQVFDTRLGERLAEIGLRAAPRQVHEPPDAHGHGRVERQPLRHVAEAQAGLNRYASFIGRDEAEHQLEQGGLAAAVRADDGQYLSGMKGEVDAGEYGASGAADADPPQRQERLHAARMRASEGGGVRFIEHRPLPSRKRCGHHIGFQPSVQQRGPMMMLLRNLAVFGCVLTAGAARAEGPNVVASIAPVHSLVASVMEGVGQPELLVPAALSDHDYAMKPSDLRAITEADLVVWVGAPLEAYLAKPLETAGTRTLELLEIEGVEPRRYADGAEHEGEGAGEAYGHGRADAGEEDREAHDRLGLDPHIWLDPVRARAIVRAVADALTEIDPENGRLYRDNAAQTAAALEALDSAVRRQLTPVSEKPFVTFHDGYSYFVERYGLKQVGQLTLQPERSAGAATVQALRETVAAQGVACAFAEPQFDPGALQALAGEARIKIGTLDAIGSGLEPGPSLYGLLIRRNAAAMEDCLASAS